MMMNERVEIGGAKNISMAAVYATSGDEQRVRLHRTLKRIAKARAHLDLQEAEALRQAQKLQLWKEFGHTSLVDYMVNELGYTSHRTAEDRLRLANALTELPKLTEAIQTGQLNMSQARELSRVATPETEAKWIEKALDLNVRQVEAAVAGHAKGDLPQDPIDPRLVRKTLWLSVRPETEVLFREARKALEAERGEKLDEDAVLEAMCRLVLRAGADKAAGSETSQSANGAVVSIGTASAGDETDHGDSAVVRDSSNSTHVGGDETDHSGSDMVRDSTNSTHVGGGADGITHVGGVGAAYRVAVTICGECQRGWQHGAGAVVELSPAAVERATCDAQWIGNLESELVERARQNITPATRRKVLHRDQDRCRAPGCQCHNNLDIHHIVHREHGGTSELSNLISLCESHHLAHHAGTLRISRDGDDITFTRQGSNRFTRATREVATRDALRRRGLTRDAIAAIMMRTIQIVGETDLTEDQWLGIALRCAG